MENMDPVTVSQVVESHPVPQLLEFGVGAQVAHPSPEPQVSETSPGLRLGDPGTQVPETDPGTRVADPDSGTQVPDVDPGLQGTDPNTGNHVAGPDPVPHVACYDPGSQTAGLDPGSQVDDCDAVPDCSVCPDSENDEQVKEAIIQSLEELEPELEHMTEIPKIFHNCPVICMRESTDMELCFRLDPAADVLSAAGFLKDYRGLAEWLGLDPVFIRYLTRTESKWKTTDVLAKWSTQDMEPLPILGNLQKCLCGEDGIDRPDVITDLAPMINKNAFSWEMDKYRANTIPPVIVDNSWQLTRQDVITGKRTYYTCCLIYADEDEGTASMITNLFKAVKKEAIFFNPQFDLKFGKYVQETTAQVIEERCGGKVIFIISEYFFASPVCQFTVQFAKGLDIASEQGNLIPFKITEKTDRMPRVLMGISGIRWYKVLSRKNYWCALANAIFGGRLTEEQLRSLHDHIVSVVERHPDQFLSDAPYDAGTPEPGKPLPVYDPAPDGPNSDDPSARRVMPVDSDALVQNSNVKPKSRLIRALHYVRKEINRRIFRRDVSRRPHFDNEEIDETLSRYQSASPSSYRTTPRQENAAQILTDEDINRLSVNSPDPC